MTTAQIIQLFMGSTVVAALVNAAVQIRARRAAERKTFREAESLDRQSITTASDALTMANLMRAAAEADLAALRGYVKRLEAELRRNGLAIPA